MNDKKGSEHKEEVILLIDKKKFCRWYFDNEGATETLVSDLMNTGAVNLQGYLEGTGFLPKRLILNFDRIKDKLEPIDADSHGIEDPGSRFTLKFIEGRLLTEEQRKEIIDLLVEFDLDVIEWNKEHVLRNFCTNGLIGYAKISDKELIHDYTDYVAGHDTPIGERVYPVRLPGEEKEKQ